MAVQVGGAAKVAVMVRRGGALEEGGYCSIPISGRCRWHHRMRLQKWSKNWTQCTTP